MNMPKIPARELSKFSLAIVRVRSIIQDHRDCRVEIPCERSKRFGAETPLYVPCMRA